MAWKDPVLPQVLVPPDEELKLRWYHLGDASFQLLPKQFEFVFAPEEFPAYIGGFGSGKTRSGIIKGTLLSMIPNNRGLVGRFAATDLEDTTQRDFIEFLYEAKLLKETPNARTRRAIVYCVDPITNAPTGYTSEISFQHMDDPDHLRGRHLGWDWIDEGSEVVVKAFLNLIGRLRHPPARKRYCSFVTGNPEGHNWIYDYFFNEELLSRLPLKTRLTRRGIHATSFENYFLPPEYIDNMISAYSAEWLQKVLEGSFDVFEGQIHTEFSFRTHVINSDTFPGERPPREWNRLLGVDIGGSSPWAWVFAAVDKAGNVIIYDEIYRATTDTNGIANEALPKMEGLTFQAKVIDYENRIVADDLRKLGIPFTNARKRGKVDTILRVTGYLHPHPKNTYPEWHPLSGQLGSPRLFIQSNCVNLIREITQQRWKRIRVSDQVVDATDPSIPAHAYDALRYILVELPKPTELKPTFWQQLAHPISKMSQCYWVDKAKQDAHPKQPQRRRPWLPHLRLPS